MRVRDRSADGNQDDTGKSAGAPVRDEADLDTILQQEAPQGQAAGSPEDIGERVRRDVEGIMAEEGSKEEARFPGSTFQNAEEESTAAVDAPKSREHGEVPAGQR